jgi:dihydroflavonol-4-reductase
MPEEKAPSSGPSCQHRRCIFAPASRRIFAPALTVLLAEFLGEIASMCNRRPPKLRLPRPLLYPCAVAAEAVAHVTRREPFLTLDGLRMSKYRMFFSSAKAERDLGYKARPYPEALKDALAWFRDNGQLR